MGELLSTCGPETNHLLLQFCIMNSMDIYEADDRGRDEVLLVFLIVGPIYLTSLVMVLIFVVHQQLDLRHIHREEECLMHRIRAMEHSLWPEEDSSNEDPESAGNLWSSGDTTLPMIEVMLESIVSHPTDPNYA